MRRRPVGMSSGPSWLAAIRHSWAEAGYRAELTWQEFVDWLRLGR